MNEAQVDRRTGRSSIRIEPKHVQVRRFLLEEIRSKRRQVGSPLPSEADLMQQLGVSRVTVRRALSDLAKDGIIQSQQGMPHMVRAREPQPIVGLIYGNQVYGPHEIASYRLMLDQFRRILTQHNYVSRLYCVRGHGLNLHSDRDQLLTDVRRKRLKGLLALAWPASESDAKSEIRADREVLRQIELVGLPLCGWTGADVPGAVALDYESVGYLGTRHFLEQGLDQVALICGSDRISEQACVLVGYQRALRERGHSFRPSWVCRTSELSKAAGHAAIHKLWQISPHPRAVVVADDVMAQGVVTAVLELGIELPSQLQLATLHFAGEGLFCPCPFVKLELNLEEPAREVCERLFAQIQNPSVVQQRTLVRPRVVPCKGSTSESAGGNLVELMVA